MSDLPISVIKAGGDLNYSSDYDDASTIISTLDGTNAAAVKAQLDGLTYTTVGKISSFQMSHVQENDNTLYAMNCGVGAFLATADKKANVTSTLLQLNKLDVISKILGSNYELEAGANVPTQAYTKASGDWSYNTSFVLPYKNANGSKVIINSLTGGTDGALLEDTDFFVGLDSNGNTTITIIDSTTVTTESQDMVFSLDFTPSVASYNSYNFANDSIPFGAYKFISCPYKIKSSEAPDPTKLWRRDYIYIAKAKLGGEVVERYLNVGENLEGSEIALNGEIGGLYMKYISTGSTMASV